MALSEKETRGGQGREEERRAHRQPAVCDGRVRVEHRQARRVEELADVAEIGEDRVVHADDEGEHHHRPAVPLSEVGRGAPRRGEQEVRDLLDEERAGLLPVPARQRPPVEEEEQEGEGHEHGLGGKREREEDEARGVGELLSRVDPAQPGGDREESEEGPEEGLALGNPRDRLDSQRVEGEERRDGGAAGAGAGHAREEPVDEKRVGEMEQQAHPVVARGTDSEKRDVQHVGEPRDRMPPGVITGREGPGDPRPRESGEDVRVLVNVEVVVRADEAVSNRAGPDGGGDDHEENGNEKVRMRPLAGGGCLAGRGGLAGWRRSFRCRPPRPAGFFSHPERLIYQPVIRTIAAGRPILMVLLLLAGESFAAAQARLDPRIFAGKAAGKTASFLVVMREQADLSGAEALPSKDEKGRFVFEALRAQAETTQAPLRAALDAAGVRYRSFYLVNMLEVRTSRSWLRTLKFPFRGPRTLRKRRLRLPCPVSRLSPPSSRTSRRSARLPCGAGGSRGRGSSSGWPTRGSPGNTPC